MSHNIMCHLSDGLLDKGVPIQMGPANGHENIARTDLPGIIAYPHIRTGRTNPGQQFC